LALAVAAIELYIYAMKTTGGKRVPDQSDSIKIPVAVSINFIDRGPGHNDPGSSGLC